MRMGTGQRARLRTCLRAITVALKRYHAGRKIRRHPPVFPGGTAIDDESGASRPDFPGKSHQAFPGGGIFKNTCHRPPVYYRIPPSCPANCREHSLRTGFSRHFRHQLHAAIPHAPSLLLQSMPPLWACGAPGRTIWITGSRSHSLHAGQSLFRHPGIYPCRGTACLSSPVRCHRNGAMEHRWHHCRDPVGE